MSLSAVRHRHRGHDSAIVLAVGILVVGCRRDSLPRPEYVQVRAEDYQLVPFAPRRPPVEMVPPRPAGHSGLVWADGGWEWGGDRYRWEPGGWVLAPPGAKRAKWVIVRREVDGQLFFAPSRWRDGAGNPLVGPTPLAQANVGARESVDAVGKGALTSGPAKGGGRADLDE